MGMGKTGGYGIFWTYEDAMTSEHLTLFHTTSLMNMHRLMPKQILEEALDLDIRLNSKEGFIRQIIGWRNSFAMYII